MLRHRRLRFLDLLRAKSLYARHPVRVAPTLATGQPDIRIGARKRSLPNLESACALLTSELGECRARMKVAIEALSDQPDSPRRNEGLKSTLGLPPRPT
jgi:hypothetical protein